MIIDTNSMRIKNYIAISHVKFSIFCYFRTYLLHKRNSTTYIRAQKKNYHIKYNLLMKNFNMIKIQITPFAHLG